MKGFELMTSEKNIMIFQNIVISLN